MAKSNATTVTKYLQELPPERRAIVSKVRDVVRKNLPDGYRETMNWGMISYEVPLKDYPNTYNGQPLVYAALAAQKNYFALYLTGSYGDAKQAKWLSDSFKRAGKKLDLGKSCLRFRQLDDLPLDVIGQAIASKPVKEFVAQYEAARGVKK